MITIHTFGDSHSKFGWEKVKLPDVNIVIHYMGAKLMYSFGRDKLTQLNINKGYNINNGDYVCFCFGEIDCRCHMYKYNEDYENVIENMVNNYIEAITDNIKQFRDVKPIIYNVLPTIRNASWNSSDVNPYPHLGEEEDRKKYTKYLNEKLKCKCEELNYIFFDIYDRCCNSDGFFKRDLIGMSVHLNDPRFIEDFIKHNLINNKL